MIEVKYCNGYYRATVPGSENFAVGHTAHEAKNELQRELRLSGRIKSTVPTLRKAVPMFKVAIRGFRRQATY